MIDFVVLASPGSKLYLFVFVIVVNHVGFILRLQITRKYSEFKFSGKYNTNYWYLKSRSRMTKTEKSILAIPFIVPKDSVTLLRSLCLTIRC